MIQGVLTLGEDEFKQNGFPFLQTVITLIVVFLLLYLNPPLVSVTKKRRNQQDDTTIHEETCCSDQKESTCKNEKNAPYHNVTYRWNRKYIHGRRKRIDHVKEKAEREKLSSSTGMVKLIGKSVKYVASRSWKGFRRKQKKRKKSKACRRAYLLRLHRKKNTKKPTLIQKERRKDAASVNMTLTSCTQDSKVNKILPSLVNRIPPVILNLYPAFRSLESYFQTISNSSGSNEPPSERMRFEWLRFVSFAGHRDIPVRPLFLARSGFYATGSNNETVCYSCGAEYSEWDPSDNTDEVHRRISPTCPHVTTGDRRNVPIHQEAGATVSSSEREIPEEDSVRHERDIDTNSRQGASHTLSNDAHNNRNVSSSDVAHCNTINTQSHDISTVSNDGSSVSQAHIEETGHHHHHHQQQQQQQQDSLNESRNEPGSGQNRTSNNQTRSSRAEPLVETTSNRRSTDSASAAQIARLDPLGINFDRPRYIAYAVLTVRISSYQGWPSHLTQTPRQLALAGFFYAGYGDYVRCFFCGGGLRNWEPGDDPWVEHARWFPRCAFLRQNKGFEFVQLVQDQHHGNVALSANTENVESGDGSRQTATEALVEMGYQREDIQTAIHRFDRQYGTNTNCTAEVLIDIIGDTVQENVNLDDNHDTDICHTETTDMSRGDQLVAENRRLRKQRLCRVCQEKDANIAMLPCGHLLCCSDCAPAMRKCPACKALVKGTVRTFLV